MGGRVKPLSLRTNCRERLAPSSSVAGGLKLCSVLMARHMTIPAAAVIAGVMFEDTIRRICRVKGITGDTGKNAPLDKLFTILERADILIGSETRGARRRRIEDSTVHADWGQINPPTWTL